MARILLIDDEPADRLALTTLLQEMGHEVVLAHDGESGVFRYQTGSPDVVVTDLVMPNMHGVLVIEHLKNIYPDARIIAISGKDPNGLRRALEAGADAALKKPIRRPALAEALRNAMEGPYEPAWVE